MGHSAYLNASLIAMEYLLYTLYHNTLMSLQLHQNKLRIVAMIHIHCTKK